MTQKGKKYKKSPVPKASAPAAASTPESPMPRWQWLIILLLPFVLYFNTLSHEYALDDAIVITENRFTQQGFEGIPDLLGKETFVGFFGEQKTLVAGGRYRPLSLVTFAVEYEFFGLNPGISHFMNILLYAFCGFFIYLLFFKLFEHNKWKHLQLTIPFLTALFFIVHPIHTEAVANIKGRDEILSMLLTIAATYLLFRYLKTKNIISIIASLGVFFLALLSKENSYTYIFIIPVLLYYFTSLKNGAIAKYSLMFIGVMAVGLILRQSIIGGLAVAGNQELMNDPFVAATLSEKYATIFYTLGKYLQLLFIPYPLTHDYYPYQIPLMDWNDIVVWLSFLVYLILGIYAVYGVWKKKLPALGIWLYLIPLAVVSNFVFSVGTLMSERFLFMPSLGFSLILAWIIVSATVAATRKIPTITAEKLKYWLRELYAANAMGVIIAVIIIVAYCGLTIARNPVWENNETLFLTDVENSPNSAKMNNAAGGMLYDLSQQTEDPAEKQQYLQRAKGYLEKAVEIHPTYSAAWTTLGNVYYYLDNDFDKALAAYANAADAQSMDNLYILSNEAVARGDVQSAIKGFETMIRNNHRIDEANVRLGVIYGQHLSNLDSAIVYLQRAIQANPSNAEALENIGVAYAFRNDPATALQYFQRAVQLKPNDPGIHQNLANAYYALGDVQSAEAHRQKAVRLSN